MKNKYRVIGLMSGSSMDGVDIACCEFEFSADKWHWKIIEANTIPYSEQWRVRLAYLNQQSAENFHKTHVFYGHYLGLLVKDFITTHQLSADFVASHGHTIFHRPELGYTAQIGDGAALSAICGLPVVSDFRSMDLALKGQGAPLVPVGDVLLFGDYDACLNLGGISNISYHQDGKLIAYDISPCNIVLNRVARWLGLPYDAERQLASSAEVDPDLLAELNELPYYSYQGAKSLGREWINEEFWPIVKMYSDVSEAEKMATLNLHIAQQIAAVFNKLGLNRVLVTGGGAFNKTLISNLGSNSKTQIIVPEEKLINFKEALIFAFLGVLRIRNQENVLSSVTGSKQNQVAGALYGNFNSLIN
jgi:anhydro-N-acetylmuramic acid kinase